MRSQRAGWVVWICASAMAAAAAGCAFSPVGHWRVNTLEPSSARGGFNWAEVWLNRDGTYALKGRCLDHDLERRGTWRLSDNRLSLTNESGRERVYPAQMVDETHLKVYAELLGADVVAVLKRVDERAARQEATK